MGMIASMVSLIDFSTWNHSDRYV